MTTRTHDTDADAGAEATRTEATQTPAPSLPAGLRLGPVALTVTDLSRARRFYEDALGLAVLDASDERLTLGTDEPVIELVLRPDAAQPGRTAGLFHVALLLPDREELARMLKRLVAARAPVDGASDHGTHEAIYLRDPDGNGLELAADRARELWPTIGDLYTGRGPAPLDIDDLLASVRDEPTASHAGDGLRTGHLHLHVGDLDQARAFWRDTVGFELQADMGTAMFVSAGGYHHHLALNTWRGTGIPPAPDPDSVTGLRSWSIELPDAADASALADRVGASFDPAAGDEFELVDPAGMALRVRVREVRPAR